MEVLLKNLEKNITATVKEYIQRIVSQYDTTDEDTLWKLWEETEGKKSTKKPAPAKASISSTQSSSGCPYKYNKGKNEGTICGVKSKNGNVYCATHKKYEGQDPKEKKVVPTTKKVATASSSVASCCEVKENSDRVLRKNKDIDMLWHPATEMVFRSAEKRIVIGKANGKKVDKLSASDILTCKKWGFPFENTDGKTVEPEESKAKPTGFKPPTKTAEKSKPATKPESTDSDEEVDEEVDEDVQDEELVTKALGLDDNVDDEDEDEN